MVLMKQHIIKFPIIVFTFCFLFTPIIIHAQNLIQNPSFEEVKYNYYKACSMNEHFPNHWDATVMTPDFYHLDLPLNEFNSKEYLTPFGSGYIGMLHSEVISTKLVSPLIAGIEYLIKVYVAKPTHFCSSGIKNITVAFTKGKLVVNQQPKISSPITLKHLPLYSDDLKPIKKPYNWVEFSTIYKATGGEQYFHIGTFSAPPNLEKAGGQNFVIDSLINDSKCSSIFYDNVSLEPSPFQKKIPVEIDSVFFENNISTLKVESYKSLDKLYAILVKLNKKKIKIIGHTDNVGNPQNNKTLSQQRASVVLNYLVKKGYPKEKLTAIGAGSSLPFTTNDSEDGRKKNRRVEIEIVE